MRDLLHRLRVAFADLADHHRIRAHVTREVAVYERSLCGGKDTLLSLGADLHAACHDLLAEAITAVVGSPVP